MSTGPFDGMTLAQFVAGREALRGALRAFEMAPPTCERCQHFAMGRCKQFDQDVPADFQKTPEACEAWVFDGIPF